MNEATMILLKVVLSVVLALLTGYLIPYLKTKIQDAKRYQLLEAVEMAVKAVQQTLKDNELKKETVVNYVSKYLMENGINIDASELDFLIEAAVYRMKNEAVQLDVFNNIQVDSEGNAEVTTE